MTKFDFIINQIDALRKMEHAGAPKTVCDDFDRFVREQIFGRFKIELTPDELVELQDYYIATL